MRLTEQGVVTAIQMGRNQVFELNVQHVAYDSIISLADLRAKLFARIADRVKKWKSPPLLVVVFGSCARGDGDESSDVDLLIIHPPLSGEKWNPDVSIYGALAGLVTSLTTSPADADRWGAYVDALRSDVHQWSGNPLNAVDLSMSQWWELRPRPLGESIKKDGIELHKSRSLGPLVEWR